MSAIIKEELEIKQEANYGRNEHADQNVSESDCVAKLRQPELDITCEAEDSTFNTQVTNVNGAGEKIPEPFGLKSSAGWNGLPKEAAVIHHVRVLLNRIFVCSICHLHFCRPSDLNNHTETVHHKERQLESYCNSRRNPPRSTKLVIDYNEPNHYTDPDPDPGDNFWLGVDASTNTEPESGMTTSVLPLDETNNYECQFCYQTFSTKSAKFQHVCTHAQKGPYSCGACELSFAFIINLRYHEQDHNESHKCEICGRHFHLPSELKVHMSVHMEEKVQMCDISVKHLLTEQSTKEYNNTLHTSEKKCSASIFNLRYQKQHHNEGPVQLELKKQERSHFGAKSFVCHYCGRCFNRKKSLIPHVMWHTENVRYSEKQNKIIHTGVDAFKITELHIDTTKSLNQSDKSNKCECRFCHQTFSESAMFHHVCIHAQKQRYSCGSCDLTFTEIIDHRKHVKYHKSRKCKICGKLFSRLSSHMKVHTAERPYGCDICDKRFATERSVKEHKSRMHEDKIHEKKYKCSRCWKEFRYRNSLRDHELGHDDEKPFMCHYCGRTFTRKSTLIPHVMRHTGEKPYSCPDCGKRFLLKELVTKHRRVHTGEKPFACSVCGKAFAWKGQLTIHMRRHTGDRPYKCTHCEKRFISQGLMESHAWNHLVVANGAQCHYCPALFRYKALLERHIRVHTGVQAYRCSYCKRRFNQKSSLTRHEKIHTGDKPNECAHCGKGFIQKGSLMHHIRTCH